MGARLLKDPSTANCRIFVGHLQTDEMNKTELEEHFSKYGSVIGSLMNRGFGFVQFDDEKSAQAAIQNEDGQMFRGRRIDVKPAKKDGPIGGGGGGGGGDKAKSGGPNNNQFSPRMNQFRNNSFGSGNQSFQQKNQSFGSNTSGNTSGNTTSNTSGNQVANSGANQTPSAEPPFEDKPKDTNDPPSNEQFSDGNQSQDGGDNQMDDETFNGNQSRDSNESFNSQNQSSQNRGGSNQFAGNQNRQEDSNAGNQQSGAGNGNNSLPANNQNRPNSQNRPNNNNNNNQNRNQNNQGNNQNQNPSNQGNNLSNQGNNSGNQGNNTQIRTRGNRGGKNRNKNRDNSSGGGGNNFRDRSPLNRGNRGGNDDKGNRDWDHKMQRGPNAFGPRESFNDMNSGSRFDDRFKDPISGSNFGRLPGPDFLPSVPQKNDCEIIVVHKNLTEYAEAIEARLKKMGLTVDLLFPNEEVPLSRVLGNIANRGCLYAVVVTPINHEHHSMTLNILHGLPQEHRNMPVEDALNLIVRDFSNYKSGGRSVPLNVPFTADRHPDAIQVLLNMLADNHQITVLQYDRVLKYLEMKREEQVQIELGDVKDVTPAGLTVSDRKHAELQSRILNILNSNKPNANAVVPSPVPAPAPVPVPSANWGTASAPATSTPTSSSKVTPSPLLNDPTVQKALDSLLQGNLLKSIGDPQPAPAPQPLFAAFPNINRF